MFFIQPSCVSARPATFAQVLELTVAESGARKEVAKRNTSVKNSFADLEKSLSAYLKSYIDDPKTEQRKLDLEEDKPSIEVK